MENNNTPEIRFPGYSGDWEERKIGEFLTESRISGTNGLKAKKLTVKLWGKGVVPKEEIYQGSEETKYYIRKAGQFIYGKLDFLHQAFGIIPDNLDGYESTLDSPAFDIAENLNSFFFLEYVSRKQFYLYQGTIANGSRKAKRIHSDTFFNMPLIMPSVEEQTDIGTFFKKIDDTIALHQQELTTLKQTKQGFLQKMFPREGESVPEVRFPGFTGDWEQRKLEEIANYRRGSFPQPYGKKEWYDEENGMPFVQVVDVGENLKLVDNTKQKISKLAQPKSVFVEEGKVIITLQGSIGRVAITQYSSYVDRTLLIFENYKVPINKYYFAYVIQQLFEKEKQKAPGGTIKTITKEALSNFLINLPSVEEQTQIGNFFKQLDDTIVLHESELEALKATKKAFLQKMFV
ncbi:MULTISPECIES: restriction endonuclease subunit S [unclassified Bacillus (in: firmicutes)]|uniref:restriction endonuclease subunit S n=1 Tax=unclassified Bacillus (in: firmicutes) TaxID=185979 RepID=UPI002FFDF285